MTLVDASLYDVLKKHLHFKLTLSNLEIDLLKFVQATLCTCSMFFVFQVSGFCSSTENKARTLSERAMKSMFAADYKAAENYARESVSIDKTNHEAHWVLANIYMAQGKTTAADKEQALSLRYKSKLKCSDCLKQTKQFELLIRGMQAKTKPAKQK